MGSDERTGPAPEGAPQQEPQTSSAEESTRRAAAEPVTEDASQEDFAALLAASEAGEKVRWRKGEKVSATVVGVSDEWVFVSLGGKTEGAIRAVEFAPASAEGAAEDAAPPLPEPGAKVQAYVLSTDGGEVVLTVKLGARDASLSTLEQAHQAGIPVEGRVAQVIKGGYEVRIAGVRAFCPLSQVDLRWPKEPEVHVGQTYSFRIVEFKESGRNVVLSRRVLLEEEREKHRSELQDTLQPGAEVTGTVRSLQSFGAFVDLGAVDALIPISELSWTRVESPADVLHEGQRITARVLSVDWAKDRISLSLKAMQGDPWEQLAKKYSPGQRVAGTVVRLTNFGAFVNLEPGIDGLVHISALGAGRRVGHPREVVSTGETVEVEVQSLDVAKRKISLSMEHRQAERFGDLPRAGEVLQGTVEKVVEFGVFVKLPSGHTGLVHNVEMGTDKGTDHGRLFKPGDSMDVLVMAVEEGGRRLRLSRKALADREQREIAAQYGGTSGDAGGSLGTLGDLLKAKLAGK